MSKKLYNFEYTDQEIELAAQLYADTYDQPIDMTVQLEYLEQARSMLNKKEPEDTDVDTEYNMKENPVLDEPMPIHVEINFVNGGFVMPIHSVISMLSCYLAPKINTQKTTNDFINVILQATQEKVIKGN